MMARCEWCYEGSPEVIPITFIRPPENSWEPEQKYDSCYAFSLRLCRKCRDRMGRLSSEDMFERAMSIKRNYM